MDALDPLLQKQVEPYLEKGASQDIAAAKAMNDLLPAYRKKLQSLYLHYLKWYRCLKQDPIHQQVIKTLHKFMDEDDMDYEEASEAAVNKRKFLLSYFEKSSSLVGLNFGLSIYVSMYVCFFLCIGLCHTNQIEATILPWK